VAAGRSSTESAVDAAGHESPTEGLDRARFEALAAAATSSLYRFALSLAREPHAAEELVQEALARAYERRAGFRGESSPETWLHRILHNLAVDRSRRSGREVLVEEVEERWRDDAYTVDTAVVVERAETRRELEDALVRLPFVYRAAVVLHDIEGWTVAEIAERVGVGLPAAKQRLRRGRMMLVTALAAGAERREALAGVPLRCWDARREIGDYVDGGLAADERGRLERHLAACPTCPPLYAALVGARAGLGGLRDPDAVVPPRLVARLAGDRAEERSQDEKGSRHSAHFLTD
jgi:RNA polymerase sigma-70 factor, ECF subfamily